MKTILIKTGVAALLVLHTAGLAVAQEDAGYQISRWYAGPTGGLLTIRPLNLTDAASRGLGLGVSGGYHLSPRFSLQLNLVASRQLGEIEAARYAYDQTTFYYNDRRYVNTVLHAPLVLRWVPFGSQCWIQPYLSAGLNTVFGTVSGRAGQSTNGASLFFPSESFLPTRTGTELMVNWQWGAGLRWRIGQRTHLAVEGNFISSFYRTLRGPGIGTSLNGGVQYDFPSR